VTERTTAPFESGHGLERTVYFSDAVIAIAMTLLALELHVPYAHDGVSLLEDFRERLGHEYMSFAISFVVIAAFWSHHHRLFQQVVKMSTRMVWLNIASLFAIVLVPFATKVLPELSDVPAGPVFYASVMLLWATVYVLLVVTATRQKLWHPDAPPSAPANMIFGAATSLGAFALSIPIAFVDPSLAMYCWILAAPIAAISGRIRRARQATALQPAEQHT
jgi:uncharacterized membrane protein